MPGVVDGRSRKRHLPGVLREDSDDELGTEDLPWEWIYANEPDTEENNGRKRKRAAWQDGQIIGARNGNFECYLGDTMLLKADSSNEAWVGIICEFQEDEEGEMAANFMWFSSPNEIRSAKKRTDYVEVCVIAVCLCLDLELLTFSASIE